MADWQSYFCNVNDKLSSILLDLDLKATLPDLNRTQLIWVWIYMNVPRADGLSSSEEFEALSQIEDALSIRFESEYGACLAGRITGDARREFYFYGRAGAKLEKVVKDVLERFPGYRFDCDTQADPDWQQYLNVLYPTPENMECIKNLAVITALLEAGDKLEIERPVWHYTFFSSDEGRGEFAQWAKANGFEITDRNRGDEPGSLEPGMVSIVARHTATPDEIDEHVLHVFRAATRFGGVYDGWETRVEKG